MDTTGLNPGGAEIYSPVLTGPVPVPGIVLFLGAAIPGDPAWGVPGDNTLCAVDWVRGRSLALAAGEVVGGLAPLNGHVSLLRD
jgi:hypothetical protein